MWIPYFFLFSWGILPFFFPILPLTSYLYPSPIYIILLGILRLSHSRSPCPIFSFILSLTPSPDFVFLVFMCSCIFRVSHSLSRYFNLLFFIILLFYSCMSVLLLPLSPYFLILSLCPFFYPFFSPFSLSLAFYILFFLYSPSL
jgi:hypothetical protein